MESFEVVAPFTLSVTFADGVCRVIDFSPVAGELYGPLRDEALFRQVSIDRVAHTLVWPNGADFDPTTLHDWPDLVDELREAALRWRDGEQAH